MKIPRIKNLFSAVVKGFRRPETNGVGRMDAQELLRRHTAELRERNEDLEEIIFLCRERQRRFEAEQKARLEAQELARREMLKRERMRVEFLCYLVEAQEEERARIARELHDETAQTLTAASLNFSVLKKKLADRPELDALVADLQNLCKRMNQDLYRLVHDLRPAQLDDLGLVPALRYLTDEGLRNSGVKAELRISGTHKRFEPFIETVVFRTVQEAVTNVVRHAAVDRVAVDLEFTGEGVVARISDAGKGFDPALLVGTTRKGWGLTGIRERLKTLGGSLRIESAVGRGTTITAVIPLRLTVCELMPGRELS